MAQESTTLKVGDAAPEFQLQAANELTVSLRQFLAQRTLVMEFLRGTW